MQNVLPALNPLRKTYISLLQQPALSQKAAGSLTSRFGFLFFLDYQARKFRHTLKNCQLENRVADSSELKILSFLVLGRLPPHSFVCNAFGAVLCSCLNAEFLNTVVNTVLNNDTYELMTALCASRT